MKMHFWERIEHRLHRHERPAARAAGQVPGNSARSQERFQAWLSRLAGSLPQFDRPDKDDSSKPH